MERDGEYDVFLSYARSDGGPAAELNDALRARGLHTFFDRSELRPGLRWIPALEDAIGRSNAVAILVGRHGIGNTQQYERELALVRQTRDNSFPVIPVLMPGCENPPTGFLQLLTWIDISRDNGMLRQDEGLQALCRAINRQAVPPSALRMQVCPYRGLEPFREEDAAFFCGRIDAIRSLVSKIATYTVVAIVGPSGSGKSSLIFAGLLPALRQQRETTVWDVVSFRPGASPLRALATAFGAVPENTGPAATDTYLENEAAAYRTGDPGKLSRIISDRLDAAPEKPDRILIYVDQWEELYAMATTEDAENSRRHASDVDKFIALLVAAASGQKSRATVVLTVRADFYNSLIKHTSLSTLLPHQQVNIPPMQPGDLRSAIETPAKKAGLSFAPPALIDQILSDVGTEEGRLPLLQFALKETWERRQGDRLTAEAYMEVGGVQGAIQKTAERAYATLTTVQQEAARRLFLRLVAPGEGQEDTRARSAIPDDPQQRDIINLFSNPRTRLLVTGYETTEGSAPPLAGRDLRATVEIAHEALIRRWPTLRRWVDANRESLRARAAILRAKAEWEEKGKADKYLLDPGIRLERGRSLLDSPGDVPVDDIRDFVDRSIKKEERRLEAEREAALADQKRIAEAERQAKEAAEEAARLSEYARSAAEISRRKLRNRLIAAATAAIVALLAFFGAGIEWYLARENAQKAVLNAQAAVEQARLTERQLGRANQALAEGLLNNLDLTSDRPLTERQRNTLWKLTTSPEAVHRHFISILSANPEEVARVAARFGVVSRSLGLQWPSPAEAEQLLSRAIAAVERADARSEASIVVSEDLAARLTGGEVQQTVEFMIQRISQTDNLLAARLLANASQALEKKLTEAQAQEVLASAVQQSGQTTNPFALSSLIRATEKLPATLTEEQAQQLLVRALQQLGQTTNPYALRDLAKSIHALPAKPTEEQVQKALAWLLQQIGQTKDPFVQRGALEALAYFTTNLTEAQAQGALAALLKQVRLTTDSGTLGMLADVIQRLPTKLTDSQTQQVSSALSQRISETPDPNALRALAEAFQEYPTAMTDKQARQALAPLVQQITQTSNEKVLQAIGGALDAFAPKLTAVQAQQAFESLVRQIRQTTDPSPLEALSQGFQALATRLTEPQAEQELSLVLEQIREIPPTTATVVAPHALQALAQAFEALAPKLSNAQVQKANVLMYERIGETTDEYELSALAQEFQALAPKLNETQAEQALVGLLRRIDQTPLDASAQEIGALAPRLAEAPAEQALVVMLQKVGATKNSDTLQALAQAIRALVPKVSAAQAKQVFTAAKSSLAWAATDEEAADWARTLVASLLHVADRDESHELVAALVYPFAAGSATEVLLDAICATHSDAPTEDAGTAASLRWIAKTYPNQVGIPICPPPPQPTSLSGLKCPDLNTGD